MATILFHNHNTGIRISRVETGGPLIGGREIQVELAVTNGPTVYFTPAQWSYIVNAIRGARTKRDIGG